MPKAPYTTERNEGAHTPKWFRLQWHLLIGWIVIRSMLESATQFSPSNETQVIAFLLTGLGDLAVTIRQTPRRALRSPPASSSRRPCRRPPMS